MSLGGFGRREMIRKIRDIFVRLVTLPVALYRIITKEEVSMERRDFVLAVLSVAGGDIHSPVQIQKLFFLLDMEISDQIGGPQFNFKPHDYGPFDRAVYDELKALESAGKVEIHPAKSWRVYRVSARAQKEAERLFSQLTPQAQDYIKRASEYVRKLSFSQLVSAIYRKYPIMAVNSVFAEQA